MTVLAVMAVMAVSVMTATALKLNPLFRHPECKGGVFWGYLFWGGFLASKLAQRSANANTQKGTMLRLTFPRAKLRRQIFYEACGSLVAPCHAILRYYRCDTPYRAILFKGGLHCTRMVRYPPWHLVSHRHSCAIPHFATYRAIIVRYPTKRSTREFCDAIATSTARYKKGRCWASRPTMVFA